MTTEQENQPNPIQKQVQNFEAPLYYTNGVLVGFSNTDAQLSATINGRPNCLMAMPLSVAKSLAKTLNKAIEDYEKRTNTTIMEVSELSELLRKNR